MKKLIENLSYFKINNLPVINENLKEINWLWNC